MVLKDEGHRSEVIGWLPRGWIPPGSPGFYGWSHGGIFGTEFCENNAQALLGVEGWRGRILRGVESARETVAVPEGRGGCPDRGVLPSTAVLVPGSDGAGLHGSEFCLDDRGLILERGRFPGMGWFGMGTEVFRIIHVFEGRRWGEQGRR